MLKIGRWIFAGKYHRAFVGILIVIQCGLIGYSATLHSPTDLEPAILISGISHCQFRRFDLFRVNPPLVPTVAAIPVLAVGCETDWTHLTTAPGTRPEFLIGEDFLVANGMKSISLFVYARWACIVFSAIGALCACCWAGELYGESARLVTLLLYISDPNLLAHGELITSDSAATAFGVACGYAFWRWLRRPSWTRAMLAGGTLGLAELSKMSWVILFVMWPVLWCIWRWIEAKSSSGERVNAGTMMVLSPSEAGGGSQCAENVVCQHLLPSCQQMIAIIVLGIVVIDLGYACDGLGTRLKDFEFVSTALAGEVKRGHSGNRFRDAIVGNVPLVFPKEYILGLDRQQRDFEEYYSPSYLDGEFKIRGGWWYYYIYGLLVKVPCGTWGIVALVIILRIGHRQSLASVKDELVLLAPAFVLLVLVSCHTEFNRHLRYVFPSLGLFLVFIGQVGACFKSRNKIAKRAVVVLLLWNVISLMCTYPHHLAYFNEFAGGTNNGYRHLSASSLDWGQDLLFLRNHLRSSEEIVTQLRYSPIKTEFARLVIPNFGRAAVGGRNVVVISANCVENGVSFPPSQGYRLTPTLWIVEQAPSQ